MKTQYSLFLDAGQAIAGGPAPALLYAGLNLLPVALEVVLAAVGDERVCEPDRVLVQHLHRHDGRHATGDEAQAQQVEHRAGADDRGAKGQAHAPVVHALLQPAHQRRHRHVAQQVLHHLARAQHKGPQVRRAAPQQDAQRWGLWSVKSRKWLVCCIVVEGVKDGIE